MKKKVEELYRQYVEATIVARNAYNDFLENGGTIEELEAAKKKMRAAEQLRKKFELAAVESQVDIRQFGYPV